MTTAVLERDIAEDPTVRVREAVINSLRAPVSTALIAAIGFVPAAIATGAGAEVQRPLATVVIGGLLVSMTLSLLVLPAMLWFLARRQREIWLAEGGHGRESFDPPAPMPHAQTS
jgi:cobalt-zinc-cadmium resistance protein CzcA